MNEYDIQTCPILKSHCLKTGCIFFRQDGCAIVINAIYTQNIMVNLKELMVQLQGMKYSLDTIENRLNNLR